VCPGGRRTQDDEYCAVADDGNLAVDLNPTPPGAHQRAILEGLIHDIAPIQVRDSIRRQRIAFQCLEYEQGPGLPADDDSSIDA